MIRGRRDDHPLVSTCRFSSVEDYCLYLIHLRAYEEAAAVSLRKTVLEIGCNNGYGSVLLRESCKKLVAIDLSWKAIDGACRQSDARNAEFLVADASSLPFRDGAFQTVVALQVIEHLGDPHRVLVEVKRVLVPDGTALFTTPNSRIRLQPGMKPWNPFHVREFDCAELNGVLAEHFPLVTVKGMFAEEPLDSIERRRVYREKHRVPDSAIRALAKTLKGHLPGGLGRWFDAASSYARRSWGTAEVDRFMATNPSTSGFSYLESDHDRALDLLAVCRKQNEERVLAPLGGTEGASSRAAWSGRPVSQGGIGS